MKLFSSYNHTFNVGYSPALQIWDLIKDIPSLNGFYVALPNYATDSEMSVDSNLRISSWYNLLGDTNYLYPGGVLSTYPLLNISDSQFNYNPSVDFNNDGTQQLLFKFPVLVGTIIMVYNVRVANSYIIYAPRVDAGTGTTWLHYDAFPSGNTLLWSNEPKLSGSIYNANSRINGKDVASNVFIPLNSTRILTVHNISNTNQRESISGFGGQIGAIGGISKSTPAPSYSNSFKGKLAAIITFENNLTEDILLPIESGLAAIYINYQGVTISSIPSFRYIVGQVFSFDFSTIAVDEWYSIETYEYVSPLSLSLNFTGAVLSGTLTEPYNSTFSIQITNSNNQTSTFQFNLEIVKVETITSSIPSYSNISLLLSTRNDATDTSQYGLYLNSNTVTSWEDSRRVVPQIIYNALSNLNPLYNGSDNDFNNLPVVLFNDTSQIQGNSVSGETFIWVYEQTSYGTRNMLDSFPDIKGQGQLWTVSNTSQVHGTTPITALTTTVNRLAVNTLNYILPLNTLSIIVATQPTSTSISFSGLKSMRGKLSMFICWSTVLSNSDINTVTTLLANIYFPSLNPIIVDSSTEYKTTSSITIDLTKKVLDIRGQTLSYSITTNPNGATISGDTLNFTSTTDGLLYYEIQCTNTSSLSSTLKFYVNITLRTDSLYLALKNIFSNFQLFLLPASDTLSTSSGIVNSWQDYRLNSTTFNATGTITLNNFSKTDNKNFLNFNINGSDTLTLTGSGNITGMCFVVVYIKKNSSVNNFFLFGQATTSDFSSGNTNFLFDLTNTSSLILNANNYVNGKSITNTYELKTNLINVIVINSTSNLSFTRIGQDRVFTDRSVKGYVGLVMVLNRNTTSIEQASINTLVRNYYDSAKYICLLHFNNSLIDSSPLNQTITSSASFSFSIKKFGTNSIQLVTNSVCNLVNIPNNTFFAFLNEDFTISMWLALNTTPTSSEVLAIYNQTNIIIFLSNYVLYVGNTFNTGTAILNYTLPTSLFSNAYTFFQVQLVRASSRLYLFVNGTLVSSGTYDLEIRDDSTNPVIGQSTNLTSVSTLNMYVDEFMVYRRLALNTTNYTPPTSEYI